MPESTIRKSKVHFRIVGSGTFTVEHEDGESPADVLKRLVQDKTISLTTLYLHADEFDWALEATDAPDMCTSCGAFLDTQLHAVDCGNRVKCKSGHKHNDDLSAVRCNEMSDEDDLERQREQMERDEIADAMDQQWNDR